jgi:hypothetical protein
MRSSSSCPFCDALYSSLFCLWLSPSLVKGAASLDIERVREKVILGLRDDVNWRDAKGAANLNPVLRLTMRENMINRCVVCSHERSGKRSENSCNPLNVGFFDLIQRMLVQKSWCTDMMS